MRTTFFGALLLVGFVACGGESQVTPPPAAPEPPVAEVTPPAAEPAVAPAAPAAPKPSLAELQKASLKAYFAAFNAHDAKKAVELYTKDAEGVCPGGAEGYTNLKGREAFEKEATDIFTAFGDVKMTPTRVLQKGDVAVVEWTATGTQKGEFQGMKASNKPVGFQAVSLFWFDADGKVKLEHSYFDAVTLAVQTGNEKGKARAVASAPTAEAEWITSQDASAEDKNVEALKAFYGTLEKKDEKGFLAALTEDVAHIDFSQPEDVVGKANAKKEFATFTKAMPDLKMNVQNAWGVGNFVVAELISTGTHKGTFGPFKPTNKTLNMHAVDVVSMKDGKIAKAWSYGNSLEMLAQLGLVPKAKGDAKPAAEPAAKVDPKAVSTAKKAETKAAETKAAETKADTKPAAAKPAASTTK